MYHYVIVFFATMLIGLFGAVASFEILHEVLASKMEDLLYNDLMINYEKHVRPTRKHWLPTNVTFGYMLQEIIELDEKNQFLASRAWLNINWLEERLRWNSTFYGGIQALAVPHNKVWRPDIILTNNADHHYEGEVMSTDVFVTSSGNLTWLSSAIFKSSCRIRVKYFPFDDQICTLNFTSWSHNGDEINLMILTEEGDVSAFVNNSEFDLMSLKAERFITTNVCCPKKTWPLVRMSVRLRRRPLFYVFNHIMPGGLFAAMGLTGFMIPPDSGEKVTMCITTMLAMGVYLKTVTEKIPASEDLPLLAMYYATLLTMVCIITIANIWTLKIYWSRTNAHDHEKEVPGWIKILVLGWMASLLCIRNPDDLTESLSIHYKKTKKKYMNKLSKNKVNSQEIIPLQANHEQIRIYSNLVDQLHSGYEVLNDSKYNPHLTKDLDIAFEHIQLAFQSVLDRVWGLLMKSHRRDEKTSERMEIVREWKNVALVVDTFLLYCFVFVTTVSSLLIFFQPRIV